MIVRTKVKVTTRTPDGRPWSAAEGITSAVDDADTVLVAHMRRLAKLGQVDILDGGTEPERPEGQDEDQLEKDQQPAEAKQTRAPDAELDQLRERAAAFGITVDRRWGVARLREEIAAAGSPAEVQPEVAG